VFFLGLTGTVYLSLRSPDINVPDIVGKDMLTAENALSSAGLNIRKRATRYMPGSAPNVVLDQMPKAGEIVKEGQTVAVVISRAPAEGESSATAQPSPVEAPTPSSEKSNSDTSGNKNDKDESDRNGKNKNANSNKNRNSNLGVRNLNANIGTRNSNSPVNVNSRPVQAPVNRNTPTIITGNSNGRATSFPSNPPVSRPGVNINRTH